MSKINKHSAFVAAVNALPTMQENKLDIRLLESKYALYWSGGEKVVFLQCLGHDFMRAMEVQEVADVCVGILDAYKGEQVEKTPEVKAVPELTLVSPELQKKIQRVNRELAPLGVRITTLARGWSYQHEGLYRAVTRYLTGTLEDAADAALIYGGKQAKEEILRQIQTDNEGLSYSVAEEKVNANWKDSGYRHRVECSDGRVSGWANYEEVAYLDNVASLTPFFVGGSKVVTRSIREALTYIAVGPENVTEASAEADSATAEGEQAQ